MAESFPGGSSRWRGMVWLGVIALLLITMLYFYYIFPYRALGPKQPIYFSHRIHAGVKEISCRFCHPYVARSRNAGIPSMNLCFYCHNYIIPLHPQIALERWHYDTKTPVPWIRVNNLPDHVKFTHEPHVKREIDCAVCHGNVKGKDRLVSVEFKMAFCVNCHKQYNAPLDCWLACHH